jgi:hypothetical protein
VLRGFNVFPTAPVGELSRLPDTKEAAKPHPDLPEMLAAPCNETPLRISSLASYQSSVLACRMNCLLSFDFAVVDQTSTGNSLGHEFRCVRNVPSNSLNTEADGST